MIKKKSPGNARNENTIETITKIIGLMEEKSKTKDWILTQLKHHHFKPDVSVATNTVEILKTCDRKTLSSILSDLKDDSFIIPETDPAKTYHWFFTDIVKSSEPSITTKDQARKILILNEYIKRSEIFKKSSLESTMVLPTGDGMAIGFSDSPEKPLRLAIELQKTISSYNKTRNDKDRIYVRIGLNTGPVYFIKDLLSKDTVWGPGIIMAKRAMDLGEEMHLLATASFAHDIHRLTPEYRAIIRPIGNYTVGHNEQILVYNIYGDDFGNKKKPKDNRSQKSIASEQDQKNSNTFFFNNIEILHDVMDEKTMMTHHTWIWHIVNISKEPKDQIFYYLGGDVPRDFPNMNVKVTDEDGKELNIMSLNVNKPTYKEFFVKLNKPLKPNQNGRMLKLEYDWEETDRKFIYKLSSNCKKFKYVFTVPQGIQIKNRILKVDSETGAKMHVESPAKISYLPDKTEIVWQTNNLHSYDAYSFEW